MFAVAGRRVSALVDECPPEGRRAPRQRYVGTDLQPLLHPTFGALVPNENLMQPAVNRRRWTSLVAAEDRRLSGALVRGAGGDDH